VFNVRDFGAEGRGEKDETAAVQAALAEIAKAGGGVLYFPRGRYQITETLEIPPHVCLQGERRDLVCLFWPEVEEPLPSQLRATHSFGLEDLTFYCSNYARFLVAQDREPEAGNVRLRRVTIRADRYRGHLIPEQVDARLRQPGGNQCPLLVLGGPNVEITDCDLYSSGMVFWLTQLRGAFIARNTLINGRWGWYSLSGSDGVIFEHNRILGGDLMATGGGLNCLDGSTYSQHVYYAHNTLSTMFGWDREAMTSDAGGGAYFGKVARAQGQVVTLAEEPNLQGRDWRGAGLYILDGKGAGQYRRVVSAAGQDVTVESEWQVPPDATSTVTFCAYQGRCLFIDNDFTDAGVALQFYGNAIEHIGAGNRSTRTAGFHNFGMMYAGGIQPNWYLQWLDNQILEGNLYRADHDNWRMSGEAHIGVYALPPQSDWDCPLTLGTIVRRNRLENNAHIMLGCEWTGGGFERNGRYVRDVLVEKNTIRHADLGIFAYATAHGVVLRGNSFEAVKTPLGGPGLAQASVTPQERADALRVSFESLADDLGVKPDRRGWPDVAAALESLRTLPADSPDLSRRQGQALRAFLSWVAQARPDGLPLEALTQTLGLSARMPWECTAHVYLQNRPTGGPADLDLIVAATTPLGEPVLLTAEATVPAGWESQPSPPVEIADQPVKITLPLTIPPQAWARHRLPVTLNLQVGPVPLRLRTVVEVGSGYIRQWMLLGPFRNTAPDALDLTLLPPDDGIDLEAQYEGATGPIGWQPWGNGDWLRFHELYPGENPVCAYAVACVNAPRAQPAELRVGGAASFALTLNGEPVWSLNRPSPVGPGHDRKEIPLREGDNVLAFKLASPPVDWTWVCEIGPTPDGPPLTGVTIVSPREFPGRPCFAPPPKRPLPEVGDLRHTGGVNWRLVYADDFDRPNLGARWRVGSGAWKIRGHLLQASGVAFLCYAEKLPAPVRIEYDARVPGPGGGDLSACWLSQPDDYKSGYLWGFGSNGNTLNKILIHGEQVAQADTPLVAPGRWHHVIAQILPHGRVQLIVDDQMALDYAGPEPGEPKYPGLWAWQSDGIFARVRVLGP
jgi:hypothetical protein